MKVAFRAIWVALILAALAFGTAGCKGGGESGKESGGAKKSGLKSNEIIGKLPAINADYELARKAAEAKRNDAQDKAIKKNNSKILEKAEEEYKKTYDELNAQFEKDSKAEWAKNDGKDIPFTMSDDFKKLKLNVVSAKLDANEKRIAFVIAPTEDFTVTAYTSNMPDYQFINYKVLAKDGSVIENSSVLLSYIDALHPAKFVKGESIKYGSEKKDLWGKITVAGAPEKWTEFASVHFTGPDER